MRQTAQRVLLTGMAMVPAAAVALIPVQGERLPAALALAGTCIALSLILAQHGRAAQPTRAGLPLVRAAVLNAPPLSLPTPVEQRRAVAEALFPAKAEHPDTPPGGPDAVAAALTRVMSTWSRTGPDALTRDEVTELYLLAELLLAPPERAGALAQLFLRPDVVLDMRDTVLRFERRRSAFDRQRAAFEASAAAWNDSCREGPEGPGRSLPALGAPDLDLWHRVVREHDRTDPVQRALALWCVRQRGCDRATVALYLSQLARDGSLQSAARRGDPALADAVREIVEAWNDGAYPIQELGLDPPDLLKSEGTRFSDALAELAAITGAPRIPEPCGAFVPYRGRPARARAHWCLNRGQMTRPPDPADYTFRDEVLA